MEFVKCKGCGKPIPKEFADKTGGLCPECYKNQYQNQRQR